MENDQSSYNNLSRLIGILPILTLIVLLFGVAKQYIYYMFFNFDIFSFLDISELLPETLFGLISSAWYIFLLIGLTFFWNKSFKQNDQKVKILERENGEELWKSFLTRQRKITRSSIFFLLAILLSIYNLFDKLITINSKHSLSLYLQYHFFKTLITGSVLSLIVISIVLMDLYFNFKKTLLTTTLIPVFLVFIFNGVLDGYLNYNRVHNFYSHNNYAITIKGKKIISNKDIFYIGKTKSNVFFYDRHLKFVTVYPINLVDEMNIGAD